MDATKKQQAKVPQAMVKRKEDAIITHGGEGKGVAASNPQVMPLISQSVRSRNAASSSSKRAAKSSRRRGKESWRRRQLIMAMDQAELDELNPNPTQQEKTIKEVLQNKKSTVKEKEAAPPVVQAVKEETEAPVVHVAQESEAAVDKKKRDAGSSSAQKTLAAQRKKKVTGTWRMYVEDWEEQDEETEDNNESKKEVDGERYESEESKEEDSSDEDYSVGRDEVTANNNSTDNLDYVKEPPLITMTSVPEEDSNLMVQQQAVQEEPLMIEVVQQQQLEEDLVVTQDAFDGKKYDEYSILRVRNFEGSRILAKVEKTKDNGVGSRTRLRKERRRRGQSGTPNNVGQGTFSDPINL